MSRAILYLVFHSTVGQLKSRLQRMKSPKYLIGAAFGILYIVRVLGRGNGMSSFMERPEIGPNLAVLAASLVLAFLAIQWLSVFRTGGLSLNESELDLLLAAPFSKKDLINYHLLKAQTGVFFASIILDIILHRLFSQRGYFLTVFLLWVFFNLILFQKTALNLFSTGYGKRLGAMVGQVLIGLLLATIAVLNALIVFGFSTRLPTPVLDVIILCVSPFKWMASGFFSSGITSFGLSLLILFLFLLGFYLVMIRVPIERTRLETGTLKRFQKRQRRLQRRSQGYHQIDHEDPRRERSAWFGLRPSIIRILVGKSLIGLRRHLFSVPLTYLVPVFLMFYSIGFFSVTPNERGPLAFLALGFAAFLVLLGGRLVRLDFRFELQQLEMLRSFPVNGTHMVISLLATNTLILGLVQLLFCLIFLISTQVYSVEGMTSFSPLIISLSAIVVFPVIAALFFLMENLLTLWLPAWFMEQPAEGTQRGFDAMGKRILNLVVRLLGFVGLSIFPTLFGGGVFLFVGGNSGLLAGAILFSTVLVIEFLPVLLLSGYLYDRIESLEGDLM